MMQPQPMLAVANIGNASRWFQDVLGLVSAHGGDEYEMLMDGDDLVVQLHHWDAHEHPHLCRPDDPSRGNGVVLWFLTDDFESLLARVGDTEVLDGPLFNPNAQHNEIWLRAPDGYVVVVSGPRQV